MITVAYGEGVITIHLPAREGEVDRDPVVLRDYNEAVKLTWELCEVLGKAWPKEWREVSK